MGVDFINKECQGKLKTVEKSVVGVEVEPKNHREAGKYLCRWFDSAPGHHFSFSHDPKTAQPDNPAAVAIGLGLLAALLMSAR